MVRSSFLYDYVVSQLPQRLSPSISFTPAMTLHPSSTNSNVLCNRPTHILWTSSAQVCLHLIRLCISILLLMFHSFPFSFFRLLRHHDCLLARTNSSCLPFMHECAVSTYRRKGKTDRGCVTFLFDIHRPTNLIPFPRLLIPQKELIIYSLCLLKSIWGQRATNPFTLLRCYYCESSKSRASLCNTMDKSSVGNFVSSLVFDVEDVNRA